MHSMPRTFLVRRGEPTSGGNDSYPPENREHWLSGAAAETGDCMMPGTRVLGTLEYSDTSTAGLREQGNIRQENCSRRTTKVMKPLQERNTPRKHLHPKALKPGTTDSHQSSPLDILATAAAQCTPSENTDPRDLDINSEAADAENASLNSHQKLPSFATLAYNIARQERENLNIPRSGNASASSQPIRAKKSPRKNSDKYNQSVTQEKENIPAPTNGRSRLAQLPFRETLNVLTQVKHNTNVRDAKFSDSTNGNSIITTKAASVNERVNKQSTKSPTKEVKTVVKPKIWNPIFHEYTPKKHLSKTDITVKTEPDSDIPGETSSNSNTVSYVTDVKKSVASCTDKSLIKHSVESMIKKDLPSSDNHNASITGDLTVKRVLPKHEEEPTAKKIKLDENTAPSTPQTTHPLTETKTPSKFPIAIREFPLYKISATPPISPYFSRGFQPSPKTFGEVALRPVMPNLQHCNFSPFSPSFGRADNVIATEVHQSPSQVTCKIAPMSSQNRLETPLKRSGTPIRVYASTPMTSSLRESSMFRPTTPVFKMETKPSVPKVLAPTFKDGENLPLTNEVEVVNGGFGIKNPSYRAPKPSDITNIQQDSETGKGKYECKICSKAFGLQRLLNRHLKCHSDVKRYLCTFCGKGFNDTFDLKRHTRIHTGVKPYSCSECDRSFTQRCSLESHCRKVHNMDINYAYKQRRNKIYVCEECGHSTPNTSKHFVHLRENHPNNPALAKCHDRRQFKFSMENQQSVPLPRT